MTAKNEWPSSLDDHELDELDRYLRAHTGEGDLLLDGVHGLLSALAVGPLLVLPEEWLHEVLHEPFEDENEAVRKANDTEYGLAAYLYTQDLKRGFQISEKLDAGMIGLNRGIMSDPAAPFGGVKASGLGREGSHHGLIEFCEAKYVSVIW